MNTASNTAPAEDEQDDNPQGRGSDPVLPTELLDELVELEKVLRAQGLSCARYTVRDLLLIGTPGGGIITVGLSADRSSWWANGVVGHFATDLIGPSIAAAVTAEVDRHTALAAATEHDDALVHDAQRLEGIA